MRPSKEEYYLGIAKEVAKRSTCFRIKGSSVLEGDMYIYLQDREGNVVNSFPCFICKKMIINAGLKRVICATRDGTFKIFNVADWAKEWQEKDILDDQHQYGGDLNEKENLYA